MAERRMFSKAVVLSARFLRMPPTSRLLYYDLGIAADDDGIVEAFTVIRTTGAAEDDLRLLAAKGFIVVLNDDLVSLITDWTKNNHIRKDRYTPSQYAYLIEGYPNDNQRLTEGTPFDNQRVTQDSKERFERRYKAANKRLSRDGKIALLVKYLDYSQSLAEWMVNADPERDYSPLLELERMGKL